MEINQANIHEIYKIVQESNYQNKYKRRNRYQFNFKGYNDSFRLSYIF